MAVDSVVQLAQWLVAQKDDRMAVEKAELTAHCLVVETADCSVEMSDAH